MKVACLVPYPLDRVPGQRFRLEQWRGPLEAHDVHMEFFPLLTAETMDVLYKPGHFLRKSRDIMAGCAARVDWVMRRAQDYDVVVIFREVILLGLDWIERLLARRVPTVFDFDDAVWIPNVSQANRRLAFLKGFTKIDRILGLVSAVSAGCEYLADHARQFNDRVFVVPTSIDLDLYGAPRVHQPTDVLTVGWTGSVTSSEYLQYLSAGMQQAARKTPLKMILLGAPESVRIPGVEVEHIAWSPANEIPTIRRFDVGVKPAARVDWARGKCPMKDIQYMALGIPCVATRFGTALESIDHGRTGFLCDEDSDWSDAIAKLRDPQVRQRMGAEARRTVEERYSSTVAAAAFAEAVHRAHEHFHRRSARPAAASVGR
jgi:glycosyltransferase involved in cell wall biosynthesis